MPKIANESPQTLPSSIDLLNFCQTTGPDSDRILAENEMLTFKAMSRAVAEFFVENETSSAVKTLIAAKTFIRASKIGNSQQCTTMVRNLEELIQTFDKIRKQKLSSPKYSDIKLKTNYRPNKYRHSDDWLHTRVKYKRATYYKHKNY